MSRRDHPALARKLHAVNEAHASVLIQSRCLHQKAYLGDLDFLASQLKALEQATAEARKLAFHIANQERDTNA